MGVALPRPYGWPKIFLFIFPITFIFFSIAWKNNFYANLKLGTLPASKTDRRIYIYINKTHYIYRSKIINSDKLKNSKMELTKLPLWPNASWWWPLYSDQIPDCMGGIKVFRHRYERRHGQTPQHVLIAAVTSPCLAEELGFLQTGAWNLNIAWRELAFAISQKSVSIQFIESRISRKPKVELLYT